MKKTLLYTLLLLLSASCSKAAISSTATANNYTHPLQVGSKSLMVEISNTEAARQRGLSGRSSMNEDQGMLFDFSPLQGVLPGFWMPDMKFNLDFIWIYQNKIIGITADVPKPESSTTPDSALPVYYPPSPVNWVLEVNAAWAKKNNIKVGDTVMLK